MRGEPWLRIGALIGLLGGSGALLVRERFAGGKEAWLARLEQHRTLRRTPAQAALWEANRWRIRAQQAVNRRREALEAWDPDGLPVAGWERWRLGQMARDDEGYLKQARAAAVRAAALAGSREEAARVAVARALIEHEAGNHAEELRQAQLSLAVETRRVEARVTFRRALRCCRLGGGCRGSTPLGRGPSPESQIARSRSRPVNGPGDAERSGRP